MDSRTPREWYEHWLGHWSDVQDHLPLLKSLAHGNVVELGTRGGVSTAALLSGVEEAGGQLWCVDVDPRCRKVFEGHPQLTFIEGSSLDLATVQHRGIGKPIDLLFVDTLHDREHVARELEIWGPGVSESGRILVHDVVTFPGAGEAFLEFCARDGWNYRIDRGSNGLGVAWRRS